MKILLDENIPTGLTLSADFEVRTVREMDWVGTTNGALLAKAASSDFDAMITAGRNMYYQQNIRELPVAVLLVPTNRSNLLKQIAPAIEDSLRVIRAKQFTIMDLGKNQDDWRTSRLHSIEITTMGPKCGFSNIFPVPKDSRRRRQSSRRNHPPPSNPTGER